MRSRWKVLAAACAAALALSSSAALAHPPEDFGTPLTDPMGQNFWFKTNFQTSAEPVQRRQPAPDQLRHRVLGRLRLRRRLRRLPRLRHLAHRRRGASPTSAATGRRATRRCSTATATAGPTRSCCPSTASWRARTAATGRPSRTRSPASTRTGAWEGLRIFDISNPRRPAADRDRLPGLRLAHEHAAAQPARQVDVRAQLELPARRGPDVRAARRRRSARSTTASSRSSRFRSTTRRRHARSRSCRSSTRVTPTASTSRSAITASPRRSTTSSAATT